MVDSKKKEQEAQLLYNESVRLYEEFKLDESISILKTLLNDYGGIFTECYLHKALGQSYYHLGHYEEALSYLHKALDQADRKEDELCYLISLHFIGNTYFRLSKFNNAIEYYEKAMQHLHCYKGSKWVSNRITFNLMMGRCYRELSEFESAIRQLKSNKAELSKLAIDERNEEENLLSYEIGLTYYEMRKPKLAYNYLDRINIALLPGSYKIDLYIMKANIFIINENYENALGMLKLAEQFNPDRIRMASINLAKGVIFYYKDKYKQSKRFFNKTLEVKDGPEWLREISNNYLKAMSESNWSGLIPELSRWIFNIIKRQ